MDVKEVHAPSEHIADRDNNSRRQKREMEDDEEAS
jgi:hypothetical protein